MSQQPYSLSDSKDMYLNRFYSSNYDFPFSSAVSKNTNNKIFVPSHKIDLQRNIQHQNSSNNKNLSANFTIDSKRLHQNTINLSNNQPLNRIQQNNSNQSQMAKIKKNLPPNKKSNQTRFKSPEFKQNIPFYKNIQLTSYKNQNKDQQINNLTPKQNLTDRVSSKQNQSSSFKFRQFTSHYHQIISKRKSNSNSSKTDPINQFQQYYLSQINKTCQKQNRLAISQKQSIDTNKTNNHNLQNQHNKQNINSTSKAKIQKNNWHRKSKSIQFTANQFKQIDQLELLKQKINNMENTIKQNASLLQSQQLKILKIQFSLSSQQTQGIKNDLLTNLIASQSLKRPNKHCRTNSSSSNSNYRQLSDIMSLIEQNKNYQIRNSDQYRKMIEEFRSTILQFRDQLNKTIKKQELDEQVKKIKQQINNNHSPNNLKQINTEKNQKFVQNYQNTTASNNSLQKIIFELKNTIHKFQDSNLYLKAEIVKINVRDKMNCQQNIVKFEEFQKKIHQVQNSIGIFDERNLKRSDKKYGQKIICFSVNTEIKKQFNYPVSNNGQSIRRSNSTTQSSGSYLKLSHSRSPSYNFGDSQNCHQNSYDKNINDQKTAQDLKRIYYIDKQGYLLDKDSYYLLDTENELIKLSEKQIEMLKKLNILNSAESNY